MKESAKLFCNVTGSPKPKVTWFKLHSTAMPKYFYIRDGYMMIPIVEHKDGGIYICRAENSEGVAEKEIELDINGKWAFRIFYVLYLEIVYHTRNIEKI